MCSMVARLALARRDPWVSPALPSWPQGSPLVLEACDGCFSPSRAASELGSPGRNPSPSCLGRCVPRPRWHSSVGGEGTDPSVPPVCASDCAEGLRRP